MTTDPRAPGERPGQEPVPWEESVPQDDAVIGRAFRWSLLALAAVGLLAAAGYWLSRKEPQPEPVIERSGIELPAALDQSSPRMPSVRFTDITAGAGLRFRHESGAYGDKLLPETMGGGVAFLDYDGDGDPDLLFVNSDQWPGRRQGPRPVMALYRNDGGGRFSDVTAGSGLDVSLYGQGVAVADYDADGDVDVLLTALGPNHLFRNDDGHFLDVTARAGVAGGDGDWSTSAGFFDADNDGDLDLFVCNYVQWTRELDIQLHFTVNGRDRAYGPPMQYQGTHSLLYLNNGDGSFRDVSREAGIQVVNPATGHPMGKALAVTFVDADRDGRLDILVSNDTVQNFLFHNLGAGRFEELGMRSGIGFDTMGRATGAMGIDAAPLGREDALGVAIGNFANEPTSFYMQQEDPLQFVDMANACGIGSPSLLRLSFGLFFFDYDLDGRLDLLQANGHLEDEISQVQPSQTYRQPAQLFWNCSTGRRVCFAAVPDAELGDLARPMVGRGASFADIDGDGDLDVVLAQSGGPPLLARNDQDLGHHWLRVRLQGAGANRDAIGAEVIVVAGGATLRRMVMPTRSYLSQVELPITFGLGPAESIESLRVTWPGGSSQEHPAPAVDTTITLAETP